jgi:hypothetical protein
MDYIHFVGGKYTPKSFVQEARRMGWSRNFGIGHTKSLKWDDVIFFATKHPNVENGYIIFAKGLITSISLPAEITSQMEDEGLIEKSSGGGGGGGMEIRECGSYSVSGVCRVSQDVSIEKLAKRAEEICKEKGFNLKCLVRGYISEAYQTPIVTTQNIPTQGIAKLKREFYLNNPTGHEMPAQESHPKVVFTENYKRRKSKSRDDLMRS